MRALLYADWCVIRKYLVQYVGVAVAISVVVAWGAASELTPETSAMGVAASAACMLVMVAYFMLFALFGADEQNGWEEGRLTALPVGPRAVVRSRYLTMGLVYLTLLLFAVPVSMACLALVSAAAGAPLVPVPSAMTFFTLALVAGVMLVFTAVQMVVLFAVGMQRARVVLVAPFLLVMLVNVPVVTDAVRAFGAWAASALASAAGAPVLLGAACVAVGAVALLVSLRVAEALYARREL